MKKLMKAGWMITLICLSIVATAQQVARVIVTNGKATVVRGGKVLTLSRGYRLSVGDEIQTQSGAEIRIRYDNGTLVTLSNSANYKILKFAPKKDIEIEAELNRGQARIVTEGNHKKKEVLKTKVVALAIIGTDATANTGAGKTLELSLASGLVNVDGVNLTPGEYNIQIGDHNNIMITTPEGEVISGQEGVSDTINTNDLVDIGQVINTSVVSGATETVVPEMAIAVLAVDCF